MREGYALGRDIALWSGCAQDRRSRGCRTTHRLADRQGVVIFRLTIFTIPSIEYHAAFLFVCSERRYHICTMAMKVGATDASNDPRMKRVAIRPPKSRAAAIPQRVAPQQNTITAQNLPIGNLTRKYATTGCQTSCATYTMAPSHEYSSFTR